jgi:hypothetical protein
MFLNMPFCSLDLAYVLGRTQAANIPSRYASMFFMCILLSRLDIRNEPDTSCKYVIKKVFIGSESILEKSTKLRETQLLAMIRHPYIVQVYVCVCVCVCVLIFLFLRETERDSERVCVCVCEKRNVLPLSDPPT